MLLLGGCEVRVTLRQDGEAWPLNGNLGKEGQFVIEVYNSGTKSATRVNFDVVTASGSSVLFLLFLLLLFIFYRY